MAMTCLPARATTERVRAEDAMRRAAVAEMRAVDCANVDMSEVVRCAWITEDRPLCLLRKSVRYNMNGVDGPDLTTRAMDAYYSRIRPTRESVARWIYAYRVHIYLLDETLARAFVGDEVVEELAEPDSFQQALDDLRDGDGEPDASDAVLRRQCGGEGKS